MCYYCQKIWLQVLERRYKELNLGVVSVPLHVVYLSSELLTGRVTVGNRLTLPIKGISLILGNDLAGSKVMPDLQLVSNPTAIIGVNVVFFQHMLSPEQQLRGHRRKAMRLLLQLT